MSRDRLTTADVVEIARTHSSRAMGQEILRSLAVQVPPGRVAVPSPVPGPAGGVAAFHRIDRAETDGFRSKTERLYAARLDAQRAAGQIVRWRYEPLSLRLEPAAMPDGGSGRPVRYVPDFVVTHAGGVLSYDQVKGGWATEQSLLKFRWACAAWPELWQRLWRYRGGTFTLEREGGNPNPQPGRSE